MTTSIAPPARAVISALLLIWLPAVGGLPAAEPAADAGAAAAGTTVVPPAPVPDKADIAFIRENYQRGLYLLRASELALSRPLVGADLDFAKQMVADHGAFTRDLVALAAQKAVTLPASLDETAQAAYDTLARTADAQAASIYLTGQITAHQAAISASKDIADDSRDGDVQAFAKRHLPRLQAHLDTAKRLQDAH